MGEIRVKVKLENDLDVQLCNQGKLSQRKVRKAVIEAVVDTGAVITLLPQDLVERLGDRRMAASCLVGPPGCEPSVGQLVMEELDLIAAPRKRTLTPRPESPYRATLKMKSLLQPA